MECSLSPAPTAMAVAPAAALPVTPGGLAAAFAAVGVAAGGVAVFAVMVIGHPPVRARRSSISAHHAGHRSPSGLGRCRQRAGLPPDGDHRTV